MYSSLGLLRRRRTAEPGGEVISLLTGSNSWGVPLTGTMATFAGRSVP
jgi:hypothetical protein